MKSKLFLRSAEVKRESLRAWRVYFENNASAGGAMRWDRPDNLTAEEKDAIRKSIAAFQLGEYSEGKGLLKAAVAEAHRAGTEDLLAITRLFIAEEQRHALLLKRFIDLHGLELMRRNWTDTVFRRLRKNVGYEFSITVLITAEIIALVYYRALKQATNSDLLRQICDQILKDEEAHVRFESEMIDFGRGSKSAPAGYAAVFLHLLLFFPTVIVVYSSHKKVLNRGGYYFGRFWAACRAEFSNCFFRADASLAAERAG